MRCSAGGAARPRHYELVAEVERSSAPTASDNFLIIGVGGLEVLGMAPPSERQHRGAATW